MKKTFSKILFIIQCLLLLAMLVLVILYFCGYKYLLDIIELVLGCDLLLLGFGNWLITKKFKNALIYLIVGGLIVIAVILKMVGVQI